MEKKEWETFSKGLLGMGTPILVLFCLVAPFGATYLVHYVLFSKVGLTKNVCYSVSGLSCLGLSFCSFLGLRKLRDRSKEVLKEKEGLLEKLSFKSSKEKKEKQDKKIVNKARAVLVAIFLLPLALFALNRESAPTAPNPLREPSPSLSDDSRMLGERFRRLSNFDLESFVAPEEEVQLQEAQAEQEEDSNAVQQQVQVQPQETPSLEQLIAAIKDGSWRLHNIVFNGYSILGFTRRINRNSELDHVVWNFRSTYWQILVPECYSMLNQSQQVELASFPSSLEPQEMLSLEQAIAAIKDGSWSEKNIIYLKVCTKEPETGTGFFVLQMDFCFPSKDSNLNFFS